jgi:hypothetical protein
MHFASTANGERLDVMELDWLADVVTIVSGVIILLGGGGGVAYLVNKYRFRRKSKAVEEYLKGQKAEMINKGQRSAANIRSKVQEDLTEEEIYKISRSNPRIQMLVKRDKDGFAGKALYEYIGE